MSWRVHPAVQNPHYIHTTSGDTVVDDVAAHPMGPISLSDVVTSAAVFRITGKQHISVRELVGISMRLFDSPPAHGVQPNLFEVPKRGGR